VYASDGTSIGTVDHVIAAREEDIFHGVVVRTDHGKRFVAAELVRSLHERGVDLRLDPSQAAELPAPEGGAPAWRVREPGVKPSRWSHLLDRITGANTRTRDWREED